MAACTQRAGTMLPVKSKVVMGVAVAVGVTRSCAVGAGSFEAVAIDWLAEVGFTEAEVKAGGGMVACGSGFMINGVAHAPAMNAPTSR